MKGAECSGARFSVWKNSINFSVRIYKQQTAKVRAEKCSCNILNNQVKILHLPQAQFTPVNEAAPPVVSEEMLQISAFYVIERGKKKRKRFHFHTEIV